jgi:hypothetical protein
MAEVAIVAPSPAANAVLSASRPEEPTGTSSAKKSAKKERASLNLAAAAPSPSMAPMVVPMAQIVAPSPILMGPSPTLVQPSPTLVQPSPTLIGPSPTLPASGNRVGKSPKVSKTHAIVAPVAVKVTTPIGVSPAPHKIAIAPPPTPAGGLPLNTALSVTLEDLCGAAAAAEVEAARARLRTAYFASFDQEEAEEEEADSEEAVEDSITKIELEKLDRFQDSKVKEKGFD